LGLVISDVLRKRLVEDIIIITILHYIKENERDIRGISKDKVAKVMHEKNICSRATTLKIIDSLIQAEIVKDRGTGRKNFNNLAVNESFNLEEIMQQSFDNYVKQVEKNLQPFVQLIKKKKGKAQVLLNVE
jgi:hypothetical protein